MMAEGIVLNVAEQAVEEGINRLSPKSKVIVVNTIMVIIGITLCALSVSQLVKVFSAKEQQPV